MVFMCSWNMKVCCMFVTCKQRRKICATNCVKPSGSLIAVEVALGKTFMLLMCETKSTR